MGKKEEETDIIYLNCDRSSALQEAKQFHETPLKPRKCSQVITKIIYLANQGEQFTTTEATDFFFAMTKLFQNNDITLRRICYLAIKEMSKMTEHAFIMTQSLSKDMTGKMDTFRPGAVRALCSITDPTTLQSIERYMKQAIVDKNHAVSSSAIISSLHLSDRAYDVVKRWVNEAQQGLSSPNDMVQYHALGLLHHLRQRDPLAVEKLVSKLAKSGLKSPFAHCLLIRIAAQLLEDAPERTHLFDFIESCLRNKTEMVVYEAASAIVNMKNVTHKEIAPAVSVLQQFCGSTKPALRYAGVRSLNKVAMKHPSAVTACNLDLENLITDSNRSIATLAITTLLKTGSESSVDRLMKQISTFISEISDEFKIVVVEAISALCKKYPRKHGVMMDHLAKMLRDEGGFEYKKAIVECIIAIINESPDSKDIGLLQLCEFIEDCEHTVLAVRVIHLLGELGPRTTKPAKYIRFIYNRIILENEIIRAASVSALAKFGCVLALTESILTLLHRAMIDEDDEVRDRATHYYHILKLKNEKLNSRNPTRFTTARVNNFFNI
jgi:coatomer protein complex subunit gamma